jgi:hypothetical protein
MEARNRKIADWISATRSGRLKLPRFQRFEAWGHRDVEALLQSVIDDLPIGAALILNLGNQSPFKYRPLSTAPEGSDRTIELLLDGQQRLTGLWRSLVDSYEDRTYFVSLEPEHSTPGTGAYNIVSQYRYYKNGRRYPLWADEPARTLERNLVPLKILSPDLEGESRVVGWLEQATTGDAQKQVALTRSIEKLRSRIANFNLPYLFLDVETPKDVVLDVFVKMNTRLVKLTAFDIIVADVEGETGESLHDLVAALNGQVPELARYAEPSDLVLDVAALLQDRSPTRQGYFGIDWNQMTERWEEVVTGSRRAVEFLVQERIYDSARLPTRPALGPLIALLAHAPDSPDKLGNSRVLLRKYLWRAFFTERYEQAAATAAFQDYRALLPAVAHGLSNADALIFEEPVPGAEQLLLAGWPKQRERMARALLLLTLRGGAFDIADGSEITPRDIERREYHHLFPVAYLREAGVTESEIHTALNCSLITWRTNRAISAKEPLAYLRDRAAASSLGEEQLKNYLRSHAIPYEPLAANDYESFREVRANLLATGIIALCEGKPWSPMDHSLPG